MWYFLRLSSSFILCPCSINVNSLMLFLGLVVSCLLVVVFSFVKAMTFAVRHTVVCMHRCVCVRARLVLCLYSR